jgi:hypothetical protein
VPEYHCFSDFADNRDFPLEGCKSKLSEILNIEIIITGYKISPSKVNKGNYLTIQYELNNERRVVFTGSEVLSHQLERYKDKIPFRAKVIKQDKYFTLS